MNAFIDFLIDKVIIPALKENKEGADGDDVNGRVPKEGTDRRTNEDLPVPEKLVS